MDLSATLEQLSFEKKTDPSASPKRVLYEENISGLGLIVGEPAVIKENIVNGTCSICGANGNLIENILSKLALNIIPKIVPHPQLLKKGLYCNKCSNVIDRLGLICEKRVGLELEIKSIASGIDLTLNLKKTACKVESSSKVGECRAFIQEGISSTDVAPSGPERNQPRKNFTIESQANALLRSSKTRAQNVCSGFVVTHKKGKKNRRNVKLNCYFCGKVCKGKQNLQLHLNQHTMEGTIKCGKCQLIFFQQRYYRRHMSRGCRTDKWKASRNREAVLKSKNSSHTVHGVCDKCGMFQVDFNRHITYCGVDVQARKYCQICSIVFKTLKEKFQHDSKHHKTEAPKRKINRWECYFCGCSFKWFSSLAAHMRRTHTKEVNLCECSKCHKTFSGKESLSNHRRIYCSPNEGVAEKFRSEYHRKKVTVKCYFCRQEHVVRYISNLQRHMTSHTNERWDKSKERRIGKYSSQQHQHFKPGIQDRRQHGVNIRDK